MATVEKRRSPSLFRFLTPNRIRKAGYAPLLALGMAVMFTRLPIMAKILALLDFASLSAGLVVSTFVAICCSFGFYADLQRRLPIYLMRRQKRMAATHISQTMLAAAAGGLLCVLLGQLGVSFGGISATYLGLGSLHGLIQHMFLISTQESRSSGSVFRYAGQHLVRSILTLSAGVCAALAFNSAAPVLLAEIAVGGLMIVFVLSGVRRRLGVPFCIATRLGVRSFRTVEWTSMLTLLSFTLTTSLAAQLDRLLSSVLLTQEQFAHYSFAWIIIIFALSVQSLVDATAYPMIVRRLELYGTAGAFRFTLKISAAILALSLAAMVPCIYLASLLIPRMYPQYSDVVTIIPILAGAAAFRIADFSSKFLIAAGRERLTLAGAIAVVAAALAIWHFAVGWQSASFAEMAYLSLGVAAASYAISFAIGWQVSRTA